MAQQPKARHWCFTLNNPEGPPDEFLEILRPHCEYAVVALEFGESGTGHLQGYFCLITKNRLQWLQNHLSPHAHYEVMRGTPQEASDYCKKDGYFFEMGTLPAHQGAAGGNRRAEQFSNAYTLAASQRVRDVDPEFQIRYLGSLNRIADRELPVGGPLDDTCGVWIWGAPGTGKTQYALSNFTVSWNEVYLKLANKWWDHYQGQRVVLLDDLDPNSGKYLVHHLKQWMDRYPFMAEYKGGSRVIRPCTFIVTSNYSIEDCFPMAVDAEAIRRRCDVIHFASLGQPEHQ